MDTTEMIKAVESVTGRRWGDLADKASDARAEARERTEDTVARARRCALAFKTARRRAYAAAGDLYAPWRAAGDYGRFLEERRSAAAVLDDLRGILANDDTLVEELLGQYDCAPDLPELVQLPGRGRRR